MMDVKYPDERYRSRVNARVSYLTQLKRLLETGMNRAQVEAYFGVKEIGVRGIVTSIGSSVKIGDEEILGIEEVIKKGSEYGAQDKVRLIRYPSNASYDAVGLPFVQDKMYALHKKAKEEGVEDLIFPALLVYDIQQMEEGSMYDFYFRDGLRENIILKAVVTEKRVVQ